MYCTQEPTCRAWWRQHVLYTRTYLQSMVAATCIVHKNLPAEHGGGNMYCTQEPTCRAWWRQHVLYTRTYLQSMVEAICIVHKNLPASAPTGSSWPAQSSPSARTLSAAAPWSAAAHSHQRNTLIIGFSCLVPLFYHSSQGPGRTSKGRVEAVS